METILLRKEFSSAAAIRAAEVLRAGGVVLYPTDTLYGLGVDAFSDVAVAKIYAIKGREEGKPIHAIVSDIEMVDQYAEVNDVTHNLIEKFPKGQVTIVLRKKNLGSGIAKDVDTFGFRIPDNDFCIELVRAFGSPVTATSANKSGETPRRSVKEILDQLGDAAQRIDLVIDAGELPARKPSTVVDLSAIEPRILREGAVSADEIINLLRDTS